MDNFKKHLQYKLDNLLSKSIFNQLALLIFISLLIAFIGGIFAKLFSPATIKDFSFGFWWAFEKILKVRATDEVKNSLLFLLISLLVTFAGIIVSSMIIAILSSKVREKLADLKKGKSIVMETNHTLILGWNEKIIRIIVELIVANENKRKATIVILADKKKEVMETEINEKIDNFKTTNIVCRTGAISDIKSLELVNFQNAKSIIILNPSLVNDNEVIKTVLACVNHPHRPEHKLHIVAEINTFDNVEVLKLTGKDELELIITEDIIPRLSVQIARQTGLSVVYEELLDFAGEEIYIKHFPEITGKNFYESCFHFPQAIPLGIHQKDTNTILINPPKDTILRNEDNLIVITADDDTAIYDANVVYETGKENDLTKNLITQSTEKILILGWNNGIFLLLKEMDSYVKAGTQVHIVGSLTEEEAKTSIEKKVKLKNIEIIYSKKVCTRLKEVAELEPFSYNSIIILCSKKDPLPGKPLPPDLDTETIVTLLILRSIQEKVGNVNNTKIVSEIINSNNKKLAAVTRINDFIISSELISMLLAQVSEEKSIIKVYDEMFGSEGSEVYIKPVSRYLKNKNEEVIFYQIMERAFLYNELAIGYLKFLDKGKIEVKVNPPKTEKMSFEENDLIVVFSENYFDN